MLNLSQMYLYEQICIIYKRKPEKVEFEVCKTEKLCCHQLECKHHQIIPRPSENIWSAPAVNWTRDLQLKDERASV